MEAARVCDEASADVARLESERRDKLTASDAERAKHKAALAAATDRAEDAALYLESLLAKLAEAETRAVGPVGPPCLLLADGGGLSAHRDWITVMVDDPATLLRGGVRARPCRLLSRFAGERSITTISTGQRSAY